MGIGRGPGKVLTFGAISAEQWTAIKASLQAKTGLILTADEDTVSKDGVTVRYSYTGNKLTVQLLNRKFFDPSETTIDSDIESAVHAIIG